MRQYLFLLFLIVTSTFKLSAQGKGSFKIFTNPTSANITLDGFPDIQKTSPAEYTLYRPLTYKIKISKFNYYDLDTVVTCTPDSITEYHFNLTPKMSTLNITTIPTARIYLDDEFIGVSPIKDYQVICGTYMVKIVYDNNVEFSTRHFVSEYGPCEIHHEYSSTISANKKETNHLPATEDSLYFEKAFVDQINPSAYKEETETVESSKSGFGHIGFFAMTGSNGTKGASWRYGLDILHYIRFIGETNTTLGISGIGVELIIPGDFNNFAAYWKLGFIDRNYHDININISNTFINMGGGLIYKPSPHFQIFSEFEFNLNNEKSSDEINEWTDQFPNYSSVAGWVGLRVAF
ncbi:peptidase associated/transthyretin-like domain-containing protein [Carboxylicivirga linearis]|uniref:PEGA domain-containing protein n=1 Tax=Carboxylicivirga linearis TaxID=1628157 RepID=A0ABS5JTB4_9BACT|nr:hypothetical protein [Carboxylicivirga linearis]MBS2098151.1 hypothetical protein [Carboxylicivirga linearis]